MKRESAIGIFDSGLGGLTVACSVLDKLPFENLVYLGDTARVPYGTRSAQTVIRYAQSCSKHLCDHGIKLLVVACNTASAVALDTLQKELDIPVVGVIEPGAQAGVIASQNGRIGIIGTTGTIASGAYVRAISRINSRIKVFSQAAPMLVPLAEEGWIEGEVPEKVVRRYLEPLVSTQIDTLLLGCTHYPILRPIIQQEASRLWGKQIQVVDSAKATAEELVSLLHEKELLSKRTQPASLQLKVTDIPDQFARVASQFLGRSLENVYIQQIDL